MTLPDPIRPVPSVGKDAASALTPENSIKPHKTEVLRINVNELDRQSLSAANLRIAVAELWAGRPVAFPTETVYGLGADASSSTAVRAIYIAKQRPADNPLIVHFASLGQLRTLLDPNWTSSRPDPIPNVYRPLIQRFWPGPLTILLPLPTPSPLAPEVTNSLDTFGARMPSSPLAVALIRQANLPLAAPSANASGKPSPTTAQHVLEDMSGRIRVILDGGPCDVGVESTVVDGLCDPPCVLRPGGVRIEEIRACPGWGSVVNAYAGTENSQEAPNGSANGVNGSLRVDIGEKCQNGPSGASAQSLQSPNGMPTDGISTPGHDTPSPSPSPSSDTAPRAPGMKYRHYAPRAYVMLVDARAWHRVDELVRDAYNTGRKKVGVLRTRSTSANETRNLSSSSEPTENIAIGPTVREIAHGLFAALRELDARGVDVIYVEGLGEEDEEGEAVMNRLRKAAGERVRE